MENVKSKEKYYLERLTNIKKFTEKKIAYLKGKLSAHKRYVADNRTTGSSADFLPEQDWIALVNQLVSYEELLKFMRDDHLKGAK